MRHIKTILRLHHLGGIGSRRAIARAVGVGKTAVADCLKRAQACGLADWALIEALDEATLESRLYPNDTRALSRIARPLPDWVRIREELGRRDHHVTLMLLWTEYKSEHPQGYQYAQFTELYRRFEQKLSTPIQFVTFSPV